MGGDSNFFNFKLHEEDVKKDLLNSFLKNEQMTQL